MNQLLILFYDCRYNWQSYFSIAAYNSATGDSLYMKITCAGRRCTLRAFKWHMNQTKWLINRVMRSFQTILYSKVGVVEVPPTFWAESLTSGGVSDEIVNREVMKQSLEGARPDKLGESVFLPWCQWYLPSSVANGLMTGEVQGFCAYLWTVSSLLPFGCIWLLLFLLHHHAGETVVKHLGLCGRLLCSAFKPTDNLATASAAAYPPLCVGPSSVYFLAAGGTSWLTLYSRGLCFCVVPRQPGTAGALSVCLAL